MKEKCETHIKIPEKTITLQLKDKMHTVQPKKENNNDKP
jgi:hypothetical protein